MYMNLRRFPTIGVDRGTIEMAIEDELLPMLRAEPGFGSYFAFWDEAGAGVSVSSFVDAETAHRSTDAARRWLARHLDFFPAPGEEFSGECFVHDELPHRIAGGDTPLPCVLVRVLAGVPATQDTRAFVEQRTLPVIARAPGFRAVWMARSDRDADGAAVATFFDGPVQAMECHETAVGLLREGLPTVSIARVSQGRAVVASVNAT